MYFMLYNLLYEFTKYVSVVYVIGVFCSRYFVPSCVTVLWFPLHVSNVKKRSAYSVADKNCSVRAYI